MRQRILGAAVILSLGFICYSILIQSSTSAYIDRSAQIPLQTRYIEPLDLEPPEGQDRKLELTQPEELFAASEDVDPATIQDTPLLDESGKPNSWAIQVGSFSTSERATEVREELIAAGYRAYYRRLSTAESPEQLYRVMVGPYVDASELERHMLEVNELLGVETVLKDYEA